MNGFSVMGIPLATYLGQDYTAFYVRAEYSGVFAEYENINRGAIPFGLPFEGSGLPPDGPFPRKPITRWHRVGLGVLRDGEPLKNLRGRVGLRVGIDVKNGRPHLALSFVWGVHLGKRLR